VDVEKVESKKLFLPLHGRNSFLDFKLNRAYLLISAQSAIYTSFFTREGRTFAPPPALIIFEVVF